MKRNPPHRPGRSSRQIPLCAILAPLFLFVGTAACGDTVIYDQNLQSIGSLAAGHEWPRDDHWIDLTDSAPAHAGKVELILKTIIDPGTGQKRSETDDEARAHFDLTTAGTESIPSPPFGDSQSRILAINDGRSIKFHIAPPIAGDVEVWYYEVPQEYGSPTIHHNFAMNVNGVRVQSTPQFPDPYATWGYAVLFGSDQFPPVRPNIGEPVDTVSPGWHYLRWEFRKSSTPTSLLDPNRRMISVYYQKDNQTTEVLLGLHGCPSGAHWLQVTGDAIGGGKLYLARIKFTQRDTPPSGQGAALYASAPSVTGTCRHAGVTLHDFEVLSPANPSTIAITYNQACRNAAGSTMVCLAQYDMAASTTAPPSFRSDGLLSALIQSQSAEEEDLGVDGNNVHWYRAKVGLPQAFTTACTQWIMAATYPTGIGTPAVWMLRYTGTTFDERVFVSQFPTPPQSKWLNISPGAKYCLVSRSNDPDQYQFPNFTPLENAIYMHPNTGLLPIWLDQSPNPTVEVAEAQGRTANFTYRIHVNSDDFGKLFKVVVTYPVFPTTYSPNGRDFVVSVTDTKGTTAELTSRVPVSAYVFWPSGDATLTDPDLNTDLFPPPGGYATATETLYIYPGGDLLVVPMTRTDGMSGGICKIEVYLQSGVCAAGAYTGTTPTEKVGLWYESIGALQQVFGFYGGEDTPLARLAGRVQSPMCWNLQQCDTAFRNFFDYNRYVRTLSDGNGGALPGFSVLSFDAVYYKQAMWPSDVFAQHNWEMPPLNVPCNVLPWSPNDPPVPHNGDQTWLADFDLVAYAAALCQGENMKLLPVLDFRGDSHLDYLNWEAKGIASGASHPQSGWSNVYVAQCLGSTLSKVAVDPLTDYQHSNTNLPRISSTGGLWGYNPLNATVQAELVGICQELRSSLFPFTKEGGYLSPSTSSVDALAILMDERSATNLMVRVTEGDSDPVYTQVGNAWPQALWGFDDGTWDSFASDYDLDQFNSDGAIRFWERYNLLITNDLLDAWFNWRHMKVAELYRNMYLAFAGTYHNSTLLDPDLVLLYNSPTLPNIAFDPPITGLGGGQAGLTNPDAVNGYFHRCGALPADLFSDLASLPGPGIMGNVVFVSPTWSMVNYNAPLGPPAWSGASSTNWWDREFSRKRLFDTSVDNRDDMQNVYHPVLVQMDRDSEVPVGGGDPIGDPPPPVYAGAARGGGWVFHDFIELASNGDDKSKPWGPGSTTIDDIGIGCAGFPADILTHWLGPQHPPYATQPNLSIPTWAIPYSSLKHYFLDHLQVPMEYLLLAGWQNTASFGHEQELFRAATGGY